MKVVGFVVLFILIWFTCDFILGRKKHLQLSKIRETPIVPGNLDIFPHGKRLFADYFAEIKNAARHIHILFYIVKNDRFSQEFLQILKDKAREGVEVRLLIDRLGSLKVSKQMVMELREAGVHFAYSNSIRLPFLFYSSQVRNHRKISIIDGKIGYLGGFNVAKEYIDEDPKLSPWRDYHLKITGAGVPSLQREFLIDWKEYGEENLLEDPKYFPECHEGSIRHQFIPTEARGLEEKYIKLIQSATDAIIIGTPYFIPSKKMVTELLKAARLGVSITIIVPYTADHILVQEASFRYLRPLLKQGVQVFQFKNGFYHAKTIMIDDKVCDIGTANFDKRSLYLNKEINCYIYDREFINRVKNVMNWDIHHSRPLTLADLKQQNWLRSIKEVIAGAVSYFL